MGFVSLLDIDECAMSTDTCLDSAECTNTEGSFTCACKDGYRGNGTQCISKCCHITQLITCNLSTLYVKVAFPHIQVSSFKTGTNNTMARSNCFQLHL